MAGTMLYLEYLIDKNERTVVAKIDKGDYENSQLIEIKVPLRAPYYSSSAAYERYYGEVTIDGRNYNYVERKVFGDTVYLLCLPDYTKNKLQKAKKDLGENQANTPAGPKKAADPVAKKQTFQNEYDQYWTGIKIEKQVMAKAGVPQQPAERLIAGFAKVPVKPPSQHNIYNSVKELNVVNG